MLGLNQRVFLCQILRTRGMGWFWTETHWDAEAETFNGAAESLVKKWKTFLIKSNHTTPHFASWNFNGEKAGTFLLWRRGCRSLLTYDYIVLKASHKGIQQHFTPQTQTFNATSAGFGKWKRLLWWPGWEEGWVTCNYSVLVAQIIPPLLPQKQNQKIQIFESIVKNEIWELTWFQNEIQELLAWTPPGCGFSS